MKRPLRIVLASGIDRGVFGALLVLIVLVAVPYGTVEPWWKVLFQCVVFALAALSLIGKWLSGEGEIRKADETSALPLGTNDKIFAGHASLIYPIIGLIAFALIQTIPWASANAAGVHIRRTISADPFQTRLFVIQIFALTLMGWLLVRHTTSRARLYWLIQTIIAIAVLSAGFGMWRQARQQQLGFFLPYLRPGFGYGQFINTNHFAFLMEMALGLVLGIAVCRGVGGRRIVLYLVAAIPIWIALVLANSRGGILSMLCQLMVVAALLVIGQRKSKPETSTRASRIKQRMVSVALIAVLVIGGVLTVLFVGGDPLAGRIETLSVELDRKHSETYTLRQNIWRATLGLIRDHPIAGVGFGGYWVAIPNYHRASGETTPQEAHSDYLETLASGGLIGLAITIWFLVAFVKLARSALRRAEDRGRAVVIGAVIGILGVSIHSLVDFGLHITINAVVVTALIAMVVIVGKQSESPAGRELLEA